MASVNNSFRSALLLTWACREHVQLLKESQDKILLHGIFKKIQFRDFNIFSQAIRNVESGPLPDKGLTDMTLYDIAKAFPLSTNVYNFHRLQLHDMRLAFIRTRPLTQ